MEKNKIATIILGVSAVLFLVTILFTKSILGESKGGVSAGMNFWGSSEVCFGDECKSIPAPSFSDVEKGKDKAMLVFGKLAFVIGILAFLALAVTAAMSWMSNPNTQKLCMAALITTAVTLACGLMFVILKPGEIGPAWGFYLFVLAGIGGIVGSVMGKQAAAGA